VEAEARRPAPPASGDGVFDREEALARCFDREMFDQMRKYFFTQSVEVVEQIRSALGRGAADEIARAAHALRGTLVYLASHPCVAAAEGVEEMGRNGDLHCAAPTIARLEVQIERLKAALTAGGGEWR